MGTDIGSLLSRPKPFASSIVDAANSLSPKMLRMVSGVRRLDRMDVRSLERSAERLHRLRRVNPDRSLIEQDVMVRAQAQHVAGDVWAVVR